MESILKFEDRIKLMNAMYRLPANDAITIPDDVAARLAKFKITITDEANELDEIVSLCDQQAGTIDIAVAIADLLGDIIVYCASEALKYGVRLDSLNGIQPPVKSVSIPGNTAELLFDFKATIMGIVSRLDGIAHASAGATAHDTAAAITAFLNSVVARSASEAMMFGIHLESVLSIIMDSNESKLDANGDPIYDTNGKFLKGPNYWKPEPKIKGLMAAL